MTLGAGDKKKVIFLCVLGALALYLVYSNVIAGPSVPQDSAPRASAAPPPNVAPQEAPGPKRAPANRGRSEEWLPVLRSKRAEERRDPRGIDPTLKLDLLAKVQVVEVAGGVRNLFQFGPPPATAAVKPSGPETSVWVAIGPRPIPPPAPPPPPPPPPPSTLKFYGIATVRADGKKTAYFLDGDDILKAAEGDILKRRYKVLRIGPNSVLVEDTEAKRQQSVPLAEEAQS